MLVAQNVYMEKENTLLYAGDDKVNFNLDFFLARYLFRTRVRPAFKHACKFYQYSMMHE